MAETEYKKIVVQVRSKINEILQNLDLAGLNGNKDKEAARRARVASKKLEELLGPFRKLSNRECKKSDTTI